MSLISTNTISQGDTRETGLTQICNHGGEIFECIKRKRWPGAASVIVSVVWICKGEYKHQKLLDGEVVEKITSYLVDEGGNDSPLPPKTNVNQPLSDLTYLEWDSLLKSLHLMRSSLANRTLFRS